MEKARVVMAAVPVVLAAMTGAVAAWGPGPAHPERPYSFGLWGDMPYAKAGDGAKIPVLIAGMNAERDLVFTAFDGDIKDGSSVCRDDQYTAAIDRFNRFEAPTVYIPGDNEWTDCHRTNNGGYNSLERLDHVRTLMFAGSGSFGAHTTPSASSSRGSTARPSSPPRSSRPTSTGWPRPASATTASSASSSSSSPPRRSSGRG